MTNYEKIKQMSIDEMARSCMDFLIVHMAYHGILMLIVLKKISLTAAALTAQNIGLKVRQKNDRKRNQRHKPRNYEVKS